MGNPIVTAGITFLFSFLFSTLGWSQYIACPQVQRSLVQYTCYHHTQVHGSSANSAFDPCPLKMAAFHWHQAIQQQLARECEVEQEVVQLQAHLASNQPPPPLQLPPEHQEVMHRLRPALWPLLSMA